MLVRRIRNRGANIVVEVHGEVLFAPGADISRFKQRLSQRVLAATSSHAPRNKRPRWAHYGKPLKLTMKASTTHHPSTMRIYTAVGSTARHAYYVDQGTGIYAGNGPYEARILPPWRPGSPSLYESTWRPAGPEGKFVAPVMIKGQKGQHFFDKGLRDGFRSMRLRSYQLPGEGVSRMTDAMNSIPTGLAGFLGNTAADAPFVAQLQQWRQWRDESWTSGKGIGRRQKPQNIQAYEASIAASKARAAAEAAALIDKIKRKEEGERKRREKEERDRLLREKNAIRRASAKNKQEATAFFLTIQKAYPNATIRSGTLPNGVEAYQVTYTDSDGEVHRQQFR